ncbi:MAG: dihydrolipoamide acetyltransferase family protein, partial [Chloroflexota bacterium]|nr:dihydrolipoamide acetyltransferase family protein [Chloroflexota bacterium]
RLAQEKNIDLAVVTGTGPGGRITEQDVLEFVSPVATSGQQPNIPSSVGSGDKVELSRMRQVIAKVTSDSKREAPHFYVTAEIDMGRAMELRRDINDSLSADNRVSVNDLVLKASSIVLGQYPKFNGSFQENYLQLNSSINIGMAIALEAGLIVPGINDCGNKSLRQIAAASKDLIDRANNGTLRNEEYSGTTFSVSNLGMFDVDSFAAIIFPPHAAVLAVGTVRQQPVVKDGQITVGQVMKATLSTDHRVADGAEAAQFLVEIKKLLETPVSLLL